MEKEDAKKLQKVRLDIIKNAVEAKELDCNIFVEIEDALQKIMAKEDEYWSVQKGTDWTMLRTEIKKGKEK